MTDSPTPLQTSSCGGRAIGHRHRTPLGQQHERPTVAIARGLAGFLDRLGGH